MGSVARTAILAGKRVPAPRGAVDLALDEFTARTLGRFGFSRIGEKVLNQRALSIDEIEFLFTHGGPAVLMKLVELSRSALTTPPPLPAVVVPALQYLTEGRHTDLAMLVSDYLSSLAHRDVHVFVDGARWTTEDSRFFACLEEIASCRNGVHLVAPAAENLVSELQITRALDQKRARKSLIGVLQRLKDSGVRRLRVSSRTSSLRVVERAGFPAALRTDFADFGSIREVATELFAIRKLLDLGESVDVWTPAWTRPRGSSVGGADVARGACDGTAINFTLLRLLSIGAVTLPQVPLIRASSAQFSLEALRVARAFGATDLGYGALNRDAERALNLKSFDRVLEVAMTSGREASGRVTSERAPSARPTAQ